MGRRGGTLLAATVTALAMIAPSATAKPLFGVVPQDGALPATEDLQLMPEAGIGGVRLMLHWGLVESVRGTYDWHVPDTMVRETTSQGIKPFFFIYGTPAWAAQADGRSCVEDCSVYPPASAETRAAFAAFAAAAVERYGPDGDFWVAPPAEEGAECPLPIICPPPPPAVPPCGCTTPDPIRVWQIWNEQNSPKYFAPEASVPAYAELVKSAGAAVKAVDPGADVMLGGMWGPPSARRVVKPVTAYLRNLYRVRGIEKSFDSIALHPYAASVAGSLAAVERARAVVRQAGDRRAATWITEVGWAAGGPRGNPQVKSLGGQARLLSGTLSALDRRRRSFRLRGVFWYSWRDKPGGDQICDWCGNAGLLNVDGFPKPAWRAFSRVAR